MPAFSGLLAPHWRDDARGVLVGLTGGTNKHHFARAVLESMAFQTHDVLRTITTEAGIPVPVLRVDGGATQNNLLMQLQVHDCICITSHSCVHLFDVCLAAAVHACIDQESIRILLSKAVCLLQHTSSHGYDREPREAGLLISARMVHLCIIVGCSYRRNSVDAVSACVCGTCNEFARN